MQKHIMGMTLLIKVIRLILIVMLHLYRDLLKTPYENPFIWTRMMDDTFIWLLENYESINFRKYELTKTNFSLEDYVNCFFYIKYDNKHEVKYGHYKFVKNATKPVKIKMDVQYNKIWEYIIEKYEKRLKRMKTEPIFIINDQFYNKITIKNWQI